MRPYLGFVGHQVPRQPATLAQARRGAPADPSRTEALQAEQIRLLYANAPAGLVATVLNAGLLALIQGTVLRRSVVLTWLAAMLTLTACRAVVVWRFQRRAPAGPALRGWGLLFHLGTALAGIGWGSAGVWLFPGSSSTHQVFLTFVLGGMMAGAVGLLAARRLAFLSFAGPTAVPVIVHLLLQGDRLSRTMGGMAILYTLVILSTAWKQHGIILASLQLRFANAELVASVRAEKAQGDHLNAQLTREIGERQRAEDAVRLAHDALEKRVQERTRALATTLEQLQAEMGERQRLAEQLRQAQHMEAIGRLAGGVAHDFNNILAAIMGYTELGLADLPPASPTGRYLHEVLRASQRAKDLVHQILTFSRQTERVHRPVQLPLLLAESLTLLRAALPSTIEIRQSLAPEVGTVLGDATQLHQVVLNLCTNAAYAMRPTGGLLDVRLEAVDVDTALAAQHPGLHPGAQVRLTVRDTGPGMPPDVLARIYDPFFTTKGVGEGTGIGLSVVYGIVASHGGIITVQSQVGQGTTFTIYLPCSAQERAADVPAEARMPHGQGRLLFVDDEPMLVQLGGTVLTQLGYDVLPYTSSVEALAAFQATPHLFDLVLTDYTMPEMTGEALAQAIRRLRPDIPIILGTGFSHTMDAEQASALGIQAFLMKPWTTRQLAETIAQVLAHRHAPRP